MISFDSVLNTVPQVKYYPDFDPHGEHDGYVFDGIRALAYEGVPLAGARTKVFAHIGFPDAAREPMPAVVLIHGGGGHPQDIWIRKWNARGYAAISMDTTGFFPQVPDGTPLYEGSSKGLERRLAPPFAEDGYTVAPHNSSMQDCTLPEGDQWMYHAVSQVILAHNLLRADPRIDAGKIGLTGISWGGVIASIVIGFDPRFAFAVPIFGSGHLGCGYADLNFRFRNPDVCFWLAEKRFPQVKMPVMWLCWNDDCCFSLNSNSLSYLDTRDGNPDTCLSMLHGMLHSHYHGYKPEESFWFADRITRGEPVPRVWASYAGGAVRYGCSAPVQRVRLFWIDEKLAYVHREKYGFEDRSFMKQEWQIGELDPAGTEAPLPEKAVGKYVEFTLADGIVLTTPYSE